MTKPGWQVTATTIYCDAVDDEATFIVSGEDASVVCTIYQKYGQPDKKLTSEMAKKSQKLGRTLKCEGPLCRRMTEYRDRLFAEDEEGNAGQ
jgi:hypothetical protein